MNKDYRYELRKMRKSSTAEEKELWTLLRSRKLKSYKFRRQHPLGPYIVDYCCLQKRLIVELDGSHHKTQLEEDKKRTAFFMEQGFSVIRFWNVQLTQDPEAVLNHVLNALESIQRRITPARANMYQWYSPLPTEGEGERSSG